MIRCLALILLMFGTASAAEACEMRTSARASNVADYVEAGRLCLNQPTAGFTFNAQMEVAFISRVNAARRAEGLPPLTLRSELLPAARFHSLDMGVNDFFGHETPRGKFHSARISAFDRTLLHRFTAENVAKEQQVCENRWGDTVTCKQEYHRADMDVVAALHTQLMNSPGHRANILSPKASHISIGVVQGKGGTFVTQLFATPSGRLTAPLPLRLPAGRPLEITALTPGWTFKRFATERNNSPTDLKVGMLPRRLRGDYGLMVRAERLGEPEVKRRKIVQPYEFLYLPGPSFTAVDPTKIARSDPKAS